MGTTKGEVFKFKRRHRESVMVEFRDEASVAVGVVERWTRGGGAILGFDFIQGTTCDGAEVVRGHGSVCCGACRGLARHSVRRVCYVWGFRGVEFSVAKNAFKGCAWEPNKVASCVHVEGNGLSRV